MSDNKSNSVPQVSEVFTLGRSTNSDGALRLQLQKEIDKLALLIQEVRMQSARVQEVADAIGEDVLSATEPALSKNRRNNGRLSS